MSSSCSTLPTVDRLKSPSEATSMPNLKDNSEEQLVCFVMKIPLKVIKQILQTLGSYLNKLQKSEVGIEKDDHMLSATFPRSRPLTRPKSGNMHPNLLFSKNTSSYDLNNQQVQSAVNLEDQIQKLTNVVINLQTEIVTMRELKSVPPNSTLDTSRRSSLAPVSGTNNLPPGCSSGFAENRKTRDVKNYLKSTMVGIDEMDDSFLFKPIRDLEECSLPKSKTETTICDFFESEHF